MKSYKVLQRYQKDPKIKAQIIEKINKVRCLGYIKKGRVDSLISFFAVSKKDTDIRMVYNAAVFDLNNTTWAPWFALLTVWTHLRAVGPGTYMGDNDLGDHFLNFVLAEKYRCLSGMDLGHYIMSKEKDGKIHQ